MSPRRRVKRRRISIPKSRPPTKKRRTRRKGPSRGSPLVFLLAIIILSLVIFALFLIQKTTLEKVAEEPSVTAMVEKAVVEKEEPREKKAAPRVTRTKQRRVATTALPVVSKRSHGKIAIVIDDWGYNIKNLSLLGELRFPVTVAVLPFRPYSKRIAEYAHSHNQEVIIHMPMEPVDKNTVGLEPKTLMVYMGESTIQSIMEEALDSVPHACGINNHMGSRATADREMMQSVFGTLKKHGLFFLDSFVSSDTVCREVARREGVKFAQRSTFLDNSSDKEYIKGQLLQAAKRARTKGYAIAIGHDRKNTLLVLQSIVSELEQQGYQFVFVSELVS